MVLLLLIFLSVLLAGTQADTKILDTPDGKLGLEPCVRVCSGVDKDYSGWENSRNNPGKVFKWIDMSGCNFVSRPIVTAVSGSGASSSNLCPSLTASKVDSDRFFVYSVPNFTANTIINNACRVDWTATGFTC